MQSSEPESNQREHSSEQLNEAIESSWQPMTPAVGGYNTQGVCDGVHLDEAAILSLAIR